MELLETHFNCNGFHFVYHSKEKKTSIISKTGHDKLEFKKSDISILEKFQEALKEYNRRCREQEMFVS